VWVAAPGEAIVTTYPFGTYAATWGTSFSAPMVSGGAATAPEHSAKPYSIPGSFQHGARSTIACRWNGQWTH